ncbi:MAG: hypothetical protein CM1200mP10_02340 [Candidatus Neomarinimicrobiota bacterium]|nr:MAG: hypothetical protein CM1200mP10_02340 [Candidatus Neomarinimicrobiota bacterium]
MRSRPVCRIWNSRISRRSARYGDRAFGLSDQRLSGARSGPGQTAGSDQRCRGGGHGHRPVAARGQLRRCRLGAGRGYRRLRFARGDPRWPRGTVARKRSAIGLYNQAAHTGSVHEVLQGADVFIGVSKGGLLAAGDIQRMAEAPIILAMANPEPEIMPDVALAAGAAIVGTGRSDFPNQVNNVTSITGNGHHYLW